MDDKGVDTKELIERLEWYSVEKKMITQEELMDIYEAIKMENEMAPSMNPRVFLEQDEAQFILNLLGNLVVGHPSFTMRRMSDAIIDKLMAAGCKYDEDFCSSLKEVNYIYFIK